MHTHIYISLTYLLNDTRTCFFQILSLVYASLGALVFSMVRFVADYRLYWFAEFYCLFQLLLHNVATLSHKVYFAQPVHRFMILSVGLI